MNAFIYAILDEDGSPRYVGWSQDPEKRVTYHWIHRRNRYRNKENPAFYGWVQSLVSKPSYRILAAVPFEDRYQAEREWTLTLRKTCDLFNISDGAAPITRSSEWKANQSAAQRAAWERRKSAIV